MSEKGDRGPPDGVGRRSPWIIRTYAGFGSAAETNARFRQNLAQGQRGLSVAFDLPTQCGYDADHGMAQGEVGRTGVSVSHIGDMRALFEGIDLGDANTSMTINATAPWLYALYVALADERGDDRARLRGTTQNDLLKEFVARGTYIFDPDTSFAFSVDLIATARRHTPRWNPVNCCGYHLMESAARPEEEVGYAIAGAVLLLDAVRERVAPAELAAAVDAVSFFINSGIELVPEIAKVRAYAQLWPTIARERYGVETRFRAGCQVRSLTLTAQQPELNIVRVALSCLPVLASADARVGALQLPGFREALGLPDAAEQLLALRTQQIWMHETGIADWPDIFHGSVVIEAETARVAAVARAIVERAVGQGYARTISEVARLLSERVRGWAQAVERGDQVLVGVNAFLEPLEIAAPAASADQPDAEAVAALRLTELAAWRNARAEAPFVRARSDLQRAATADSGIVEASIAFAKAGGTTGEWASAILEVRGPRWSADLGVGGGAVPRPPPGRPTGSELPASSTGTRSPGTPGATESPGAPGATESPGTSAATESPGTPGATESPGTPGATESPGTATGYSAHGGSPSLTTGAARPGGHARTIVPTGPVSPGAPAVALASRQLRMAPTRVLLAKAGLDGHTNALRLLAMGLRDAGMEVVWLGPGSPPASIARAAVSEGVDAIGLSSLSGAHLWVARELRAALRREGAADLPILVGGILPVADHGALLALGVGPIFGPGASVDSIVAAFEAAAAGSSGPTRSASGEPQP